ncbi:MAG: GNAT family N-acetyltransferase [Chitinophagaceae bacterium]|nr:GNAT family N-acetyltransferase [Rubrivivax sp.]
MNAHILSYEPTDAVELVRMWRESFEHGVGITDPNPIEGQLAYFLNDVVPSTTTRVVKQDKVIVAFLASTPDSVTQLYVRVQNIGQGIGRRLMALAKAESRGSLWLYTFAQNSHARRFYEHQGFVEVERESANTYQLEAIKYGWRS